MKQRDYLTIVDKKAKPDEASVTNFHPLLTLTATDRDATTLNYYLISLPHVVPASPNSSAATSN